MTKTKHPHNRLERMKARLKKELSEKRINHTSKVRRKLKESLEERETFNELKESITGQG